MNEDLSMRLDELAKRSNPFRPMLIQHYETNTKTGCRMKGLKCLTHEEKSGYHVWHSWTDCAHKDLPVFHRNVIPTEILFEADFPAANTDEGWKEQREQVLRLVGVLKKNNIEYELCFSGSKSFHVTIYFDPLTTLPNLDYKSSGIDGFKLARLVIWAELARQAKTTVQWDDAAIDGSIQKKGDMVRLEGSTRPKAFPKTWIKDIPSKRMKDYEEWKIPPLANPFTGSNFRTLITEEFERQVVATVERKAKMIDVTDKRIQQFIALYGKDWKRLVPSWRNWFTQGTLWPPRTRQKRGTMSMRAMAALGMTENEISAEMDKLKEHVDDPEYPFEQRWYSQIQEKMKNPLTEIDNSVFHEMDWEIRISKGGKAEDVVFVDADEEPTEKDLAEVPTEKDFEAPMQAVQDEPVDDALDALVRTKTWADVIDIFEKHIKFPNKYNYVEVLLLACQSRLSHILSGSAIYLYFTGIFSSGKPNETELATFLAGGHMLAMATEASIGRTYEDSPHCTVGLDEIDQLISKYPTLESFLRTTYNWNATMSLSAMNESGNWIPKRICVGGPKFFCGYDNIDIALASRGVGIEMQRNTNEDQIIEKVLGFPLMRIVKRWLDFRCKDVEMKWNREKFEAYLRSNEFATKIRPFIGKNLLPRKVEMIIMLLGIGTLIDVDIAEVLNAYATSEPTLTNKMEIYKSVFLDIKKSATSGVRALTYGIDGVAELRTTETGVEIRVLDLLHLMNDRLPKGEIGTGYWPRVLETLGFTKGVNWLKETRRNDWRQHHYIIIDNKKEETA